MKRRYTINRPEISDQKILAHQDFDKVLKGYHGAGGAAVTTGVNKWRFALGITLVLGAAGGWFINDYVKDETATKTTAIEVKTNAVEEKTTASEMADFSLANVHLDHEIFHVDGTARLNAKTRTGSRISIPANAFVHKNGNPVKGDVVVEFQEASNAYEMFLRTMKYDQSSDKIQYDSQKMVQIHASANGREVDLVKPITIDFGQLDHGPGYHLNVIEEKHEFMADPMVETFGGDPDLAGEEMSMPILASSHHYVFTVDIDHDEFPEFGAYKNAVFAVNTKLVKFDPHLYEIQWDALDLIPTDVDHHYEMELLKGDTTVRLPVFQVFNQKDYEKEMAAYKKNQEARKKSEQVVTRVSGKFIINKLGLMSYETQVDLEDLKPVKLNIRDEENNQVEVERLFVSDRGSKKLMGFKSAKVKVAPNSEVMVWGISEDGKLIVPKEREWIKYKDLSSTLTVERIDPESGLQAIQSVLQGAK